MKRIIGLLAAPFIALAMAGAALSAPIPYVNAPLDTVQATVNQGLANVNNSGSLGSFLQPTTAATGSAGASTCNGQRCQITTESLATAASSTFTETVTDSAVAANSLIFASVTTAGTGVPVVANVTPSAGQVILKIQNVATAAAFNNTLTIDLFVVN